MPDSRARHTRGSGRLSWRRIAVSVLDVIGNCTPDLVGNWCRERKEPPSGRRLLEDCDWAVAAYEDASGAGSPRLAYEEEPQVRPMTGSARQRTWRHICLLVRGSIEIGSFFGARRSYAPSQDATNSLPRQPNFSASSCPGRSIIAQIPYGDNGFRWQLGNSQDSEPGCGVLSNEQRASRRGRRAEPVPQVC